MTPIVSIITPCYNAASYIAQTIESVQAQTFGDWEMLIVDDCSTDDSAVIISAYQATDERIRYFRTDAPSGSPSKPRNIAMEQARGRYIAFLDSDDLWLPHKLEEQLAFMERGGYGFVYSDYEKMTWDGSRSNRIIHARSVSSYWDTLESNEIPCLTVLVRKNLLEGLSFKSIPKEDLALWLEVLRRGHDAYNTGQVHALYREARNSRSSNKWLMFKQQWYILRRIERVKLVPSLYFMIPFALKGFAKYLK